MKGQCKMSSSSTRKKAGDKKKNCSHVEKSVSFNPKVKCQVPRKIRTVTEADMYKKWYSSEDFDDMEQENKETMAYVRRLRKRGLYDSSESICLLGLEWDSPDMAEKMNRRIDKMINAVLQEQRRQRKKGADDIDPVPIARACEKISKKAIQDARKRAQGGEQEEKEQQHQTIEVSPGSPTCCTEFPDGLLTRKTHSNQTITITVDFDSQKGNSNNGPAFSLIETE